MQVPRQIRDMATSPLHGLCVACMAWMRLFAENMNCEPGNLANVASVCQESTLCGGAPPHIRSKSGRIVASEACDVADESRDEKAALMR